MRFRVAAGKSWDSGTEFDRFSIEVGSACRKRDSKLGRMIYAVRFCWLSIQQR